MIYIHKWFPKKSKKTWKEIALNGVSFNRVSEIIKYLIKNNFNYKKTLLKYNMKPLSLRENINIYRRYTGKYIPSFHANHDTNKYDISKIGIKSLQRITKYYYLNGLERTSKIFGLSYKSIKYLIKYAKKNEYNFSYDQDESNDRIHRCKMVVEDLINNNFDYELICKKYSIKVKSLAKYICNYNKNFKTKVPIIGINHSELRTNEYISKIKNSFYKNGKNIEKTANELGLSPETVVREKSYFYLVD